MGTFAKTAVINYCSSFADQEKKKLSLSVSVCSKQMEFAVCSKQTEIAEFH
jgi:hypothetical protein